MGLPNPLSVWHFLCPQIFLARCGWKQAWCVSRICYHAFCCYGALSPWAEVSHALLVHVHQGILRPFKPQAGCKQRDPAGSAYRASGDSARKETTIPGRFRRCISASRKHELCIHMGSDKPTSSTFLPTGDGGGVGGALTLLFLSWDEIYITKGSILKCEICWHLEYSQCCVTTTSMPFWNIPIILIGNLTFKSSLPPICPSS